MAISKGQFGDVILTKTHADAARDALDTLCAQAEPPVDLDALTTGRLTVTLHLNGSNGSRSLALNIDKE